MGNTVGQPSRITAQDKALLDMKNQRDKLHQYQKRLTHLTLRETQIARECLASGNKRGALLALRKKKYQESLVTKTDAQLAQLERLASDVEFALVQKDVLFGLQQGTKVLQQIHKEMGGIDRVELIMSESAEARAYQAEISDAMGAMSNADEDEVEDELQRLQREVNRVPDLPGTEGLVQPMPDVVTDTPRERAARRAQARTEAEAMPA